MICFESRFYTSHRVKRMTEYRKNKYGGEFLFLCVNSDAVETAGYFGTGLECSANF